MVDQLTTFNNIHRFILACMTVLAMLAFLAKNVEAAEPRHESTITGEHVTLGDVFDGVTDNADYILANAPSPDKPLVLNVHDLTRIAQVFSLDWRAMDPNRTVVIRRAASVVGEDKIAGLLRAEARRQTGGAWELQPFNRDYEVTVPGEGRPHVEISGMTLDRVRGVFDATVEFSNGDETLRREISGRAWRMVDVPVLSQRMRRGDVISRHDVEFIEMRESDVAHNIILDPENLVGMTPRRGVAALKPVAESDVNPPLVVRKGDRVTMVLKRGALSLTAKGRAMMDGAEGDVVRIQNASSRRVVEGEVTGPQEVTVTTAINAL